MDDDNILYPEIRNYIDDSTILNPEIRCYRGMDSRLCMAAEEGNVNALNKLIAEKVNIFQQFTGLGNGVLHIAISSVNFRFAERVLKEVVKDEARREFIRAKNSDGNSALHLAALHGKDQLVENLVMVMKGEDVEGGDDFLSSKNLEGNTALHQAAKGTYYAGRWIKGMYYKRSHWKGRYIKVVQVLLNHNNDLINLQNDEGETALFVASQKGHTWIVEELLAHTACNSNMKRRDGQRPLHSAVLNGGTGVVEKLLKHSAELAKETDNCGRTAMHMLALSFRISGFLRESHFFGRNTSAEIVGQLVAKDNSLCYKEDNNKQTPIHLAVEWERYDLVNILLLCGRDQIEAVDKYGRKPLHLAVLNTSRLTRTVSILEVRQFKVMLFSLISAESVNHRDNSGRTPLHLALENVEKDPVLYQSIINALQRNWAPTTPSLLSLIRRMEQSPPKPLLKAEIMSINSVLIATVSFAAAFTLPGGLDSEHKAVLMKTPLFKMFVVCDTFSFCASIASAIIIQFADKPDGQQERPQVIWSINLMSLALVSLLVAFGAALHMVISPSPWLVGTVWAMLSFSPLFICFVQQRSKINHLNQIGTVSTIFFASAVALAVGGSAFVFLFEIFLNLFLITGISYTILYFTRASRIRSLKQHIDQAQ